METGERSKSQHAMTYPLQIDMGQYLPRDAHGNKREVWYDLKGVLMHKGVSAHHGHYVAQVYDERCVPFGLLRGRKSLTLKLSAARASGSSLTTKPCPR